MSRITLRQAYGKATPKVTTKELYFKYCLQILLLNYCLMLEELKLDPKKEQVL